MVRGDVVLGRTFTLADPDIADSSNPTGGVTSGTVNGIIRFTGAETLKKPTQNNFVVESGGRIISGMANFTGIDNGTPWVGNNIIGGSNLPDTNSGNFIVKQGGEIDLTKGALVLDMANDSLISGAITYGAYIDPATGNRRIYSLFGTDSQTAATTNLTLDANADIEFTNDFLVSVSDETIATKYNTIIDLDTGNNGTLDTTALKAHTWNAGFMGDYTLVQDAGSDKLHVKVANRAAKFDGTYDDYNKFRDAVNKSDIDLLGSDGLMQNVYRNAVNHPVTNAPLPQLVGDPNDFSAPYDPTLNPGAALHRGYFNAVLLQQLLPGDVSLANLYTGANGGRVLDVAMRSVDKFGTAIFDHIGDNRRLRRIAQMNVASDNALAARLESCDPVMGGGIGGRLWASGFGLWEDADDRSGFDGYKYKSGGVMAGYDQFVGDFIFGGAFAYTTGDFEDKSAISNDSDIESYSFSLNATYQHQSGFFASVVGAYSYSDNDIRELRTHYDAVTGDSMNLWNSADYHSNTWSIHGRLGYEIRLGNSFFVTPSVGYTYIRAKSKDHTQHVEGLAFARYSGLEKDGHFLPVKLNLEYAPYCSGDSRLSFFANAGYTYNFNDDDFDGTVHLSNFVNPTPIAAAGREIGHHSWNVGGGLKYGFKSFDFAVQYDYYGRAKYDAHQVTGTIGISF